MLSRPLSSLRRSDRGVAAVEFALVLPVMLVILFGGYEYSRMLAVMRKVTITSRALADLTTHYSSVTGAQMTTVMNASAQIFAPYSTTGMTIVISEVYVSALGISTVVWSQATNTTQLTPNQIVVLPGGIAQANSYLIWAQVGYTYTPVFSYLVHSQIKFNDQLMMSPRISISIPLTS